MMASHSSKKVIYASLVANLLIALSKFFGAFVTNSSAMLSEGVHSVVDSGNQVLLLIGKKMAQKPADERHPFGYGRKLYVYSFGVAFVIFFFGGLYSLNHGWHKFQHPEPITDVWLNYAILVFAILVEGRALYMAMQEFLREKGDRTILEAFRDSKDPTILTLCFEDTAAVLGLFIALGGLYASHVHGVLWADGFSSLLIGVVLLLTAGFLGYEIEGLLVGEAADKKLLSAVRATISDTYAVVAVNEILSQHLGPNEVLLCISIDIEDTLKAGRVERYVTALGRRIKDEHPTVKRVFIEIQSAEDSAEDAADLAAEMAVAAE